MLSVAISTRRVQSLSLRSLMDCVALHARVAAGVTWWREGTWCWSGNGLANGASTCSQPDDIDCSGCLRAPSCGTPPPGDTSQSDAGCSRGLPHSEVPDNDSPPDRAPSCSTENRSHPASGPANTESWVRRFNPWAPMEWPRGSPWLASFSWCPPAVVIHRHKANAW